MTSIVKKRHIITSMTILALIIPVLSILAQSGGPPRGENFQNLAKAIDTENSVNTIGEFWQKRIVPFFRNLSGVITNWWQKSGRVFVLDLHKRIILFLEKEIVI